MTYLNVWFIDKLVSEDGKAIEIYLERELSNGNVE